jgi:hypothetical protein
LQAQKLCNCRDGFTHQPNSQRLILLLLLAKMFAVWLFSIENALEGKMEQKIPQTANQESSPFRFPCLCLAKILNVQRSYASKA